MRVEMNEADRNAFNNLLERTDETREAFFVAQANLDGFVYELLGDVSFWLTASERLKIAKRLYEGRPPRSNR